MLQAYLSYELDDLDKDVEGCVPWHHTPGAFGEKCWNDAEQSTSGGKRGVTSSVNLVLSNKGQYFNNFYVCVSVCGLGTDLCVTVLLSHLILIM